MKGSVVAWRSKLTVFLFLATIPFGLGSLAACSSPAASTPTPPLLTTAITTSTPSGATQVEAALPGQPMDETPSPVGEASVYKSSMGVTLIVPAGWQPDGLDRFSGPDGFARIEDLGISNHWNSLARMCEREANGHPERYGAEPALYRGDAGGKEACYILGDSGGGQPAESGAVLRGPDNAGSRYMLLHADALHLEGLASSLTFMAAGSANTATPVPVLLPSPGAVNPTPPLTSIEVAGIRVDEYAVVSSSIDTPNHFEFTDRLPAALLARRGQLAAARLEEMLNQANGVLQPFGYELWSDPPMPQAAQSYSLFKDGTLLLKGIEGFQAALPSSDGKDFAMGLDLATDGSMLLQAGGLTSYDPSQHGYTWPVYAASELVTVETRLENPDRIYVLIEGKEVFSYAALPAAVKNPVDGLWSWNGQWFLGVNGQWIVDGKPFNSQDGWEETFGWQLLAGRPFHFFTRGNKTGITIDELPLPVEYDEVIHGECCEPSAFNPGGYQARAWFYARRLGTWYYVEVSPAN